MLKLRSIGKALTSFGNKDSRSEKTAAQKQARLFAAVSAAPIGIALATIDGHWLHFNEAFRSLLGYTREELARITFVSLTHPEDAKRELALVKRMLAGEAESYRIEKRVVDKKGKHHPIYVSAAICRGGKGEGDFFVYVADAVRQRTESGHDADRFAASILEQLGDVAVIRTDSRGLITGWNSGAQKIFGYRADEVVTKHRRILYRDIDAWGDKPEAQLTAATMQRRAEVEEFRVRRDGTDVWVKSILTAYAPDGMVKGFVETISPADGNAISAIDTTRAVAEIRGELDKERSRAADAARRIDELQAANEKTSRESNAIMQKLRDEVGRRRSLETQLDEAKRALEAAQAQSAKFELDFDHAVAAAAPEAPAVAAAPEPPLPEPPPIFAHLFEAEPTFTVTDIETEAEPEPEPEPIAPPPQPEPIRVVAEVIPISSQQPVDYEWQQLQGKELFERMAQFANEKRTGVFIATDGERERAILFVQGAILSCASDDPGMLLSERLVVDGLIDRAIRARALDVVEETHLSFGRVLLLMDAITEEELLAALRRKIDEEIEAIASWGVMQWTFIDRAQPEGKLVPMRVDVETIIRRLSKRAGSKAMWMAAVNGRKYHAAKCVIMVKVEERDRVLFANEKTAQARGFAPCSKCVPIKKKAAPAKKAATAKAKTKKRARA